MHEIHAKEQGTLETESEYLNPKASPVLLRCVTFIILTQFLH